MKPRLIFLFVAINSFVTTTALAQHVHGVVQLGVVVEENSVAVSLNAPMSDVVGFEHEPKNEDQATKIEEAASMLADAGAMFGLPESASCKISGTSIDGPTFVTKHLAEVSIGEAGHGHDHHDAQHSHDSESGYDDHQHNGDDHEDHHHGDDHDDHHHHGDDEHSEINANYEWACADVSKIDVLELRFTKGFASVETIEVQLLTPAGAQVMKKEGRVASIPLSSS